MRPRHPKNPTMPHRPAMPAMPTTPSHARIDISRVSKCQDKAYEKERKAEDRCQKLRHSCQKKVQKEAEKDLDYCDTLFILKEG